MKRRIWHEWATPLSVGASLATLVVAVVVQPAWGQMTPQCSACQGYWYNQGEQGKFGCEGTVGYYREQCAWALVRAKCFNPVPGQSYTEPCWGKQNGDPYFNCGSDYCMMTTCPQWGASVCTNFCGTCNSSGNSCNLLKNKDPEPPPNLSSDCYYVCGCGNPVQ